MTTYLTTVEAEQAELDSFKVDGGVPEASMWHPDHRGPIAEQCIIHGDSSPMPLGAWLSCDSVGRLQLQAQYAHTRYTLLPLHRYIRVDGLFPPAEQAP